MRCPSCRFPAVEHDAACRQCGFSLEALDRQMGIPLMLRTPVSDLAHLLTAGGKRAVQRAARTLEQRFPDITFVAVLTDIPPEVPPAIYAFSIFNRGSLFSALEKGGGNHGVLLLLDSILPRATAMIGYGLEPFIGETVLEVCLTAASPSIAKEQPAAAIESFLRELDRQLSTIVEALPCVFGYDEHAAWFDSSTGLATQSLLTGSDDDLF